MVSALIAMVKMHISYVSMFLPFLVLVVQGLRDGATNEAFLEISKKESCFTIQASDGDPYRSK